MAAESIPAEIIVSESNDPRPTALMRISCSLRPDFRAHPAGMENPPLQARTDRPEQAAWHEPFAGADAFHPEVSGQRKFGEPFGFATPIRAISGRQLPLGLTHVRAAAEQVGGQADRNFRRYRRHRRNGESSPTSSPGCWPRRTAIAYMDFRTAVSRGEWPPGGPPARQRPG